LVIGPFYLNEMDYRSQSTSGATWNFIGLFFAAFGANTVLALFLLVYGVLESWGFDLPSGKSNSSYSHETNSTIVLCALLIIGNLGILARLSFTARPSKVLGYLAGAILPIGIACYCVFTGKIKL